MRGALLPSAILLAALPSCSSSSSATPDPTCEPGPNKTWVISALSFTRENPVGVSPGFDLDHSVSRTPEELSCGKLDLTGPDGTPGVDNQLARVIPLVEQQVGNAIDGIIQGAINDGRLTIALDLLNVNHAVDDRCVDIEVKLGQGKPSLGTDGTLEAYQTYDARKEGQLLSPGKGGKFEKGVFTIGPFPLRIPIAIFDVSFTIFIRDALIRFKLDDDGNAEGLLGGGISIEEVADGVKNGAGVAPLIPQIKAVGTLYADMGYDPNIGKCSLVSAALAFKARPAFIRR